MAAYSNHFVVSVINNEKPLREFNKNGKRTCIVPYGSEYKLRLKNNTERKTKVLVEIDGTDVLFGSALILNPNESLDLERFLTNSKKGNKFKFESIDKAINSGEINDPYSKENGHIKVTFFKQVDYTLNTSIPLELDPIYYSTSAPSGLSAGYATLYKTGQNPLMGAAFYTSNANAFATNNVTSTNSLDINKSRGVTVEGSVSEQKFENASNFLTEFFGTSLDIYLEGPAIETPKATSTQSETIYEQYIKPGLQVNASEKDVIISKKWFNAWQAALILENK